MAKITQPQSDQAELEAIDARLQFIETIARGESVCVLCGCSDFNACPEGCSWSFVFPSAPVGVCSSCITEFRTLVLAERLAAEQNKKGRSERSGRVKPFEP